MANLNKVMLIGNLTRDPDLKYTPNGTAVTEFGIAVNRNYKQGEEWKKDVCYIDITVWGRQAVNCGEYLSKGSQVFLEGRLRYNSWEDKEGKKRNKLDVVADNVLFLTRGKSGGPDSVAPQDEPEGSYPPYNDEAPF